MPFYPHRRELLPEDGPNDTMSSSTQTCTIQIFIRCVYPTGGRVSLSERPLLQSMSSSQPDVEMQDFSPRLRVFAGEHKEIANVKALRNHVQYLEYVVRFKMAQRDVSSRIGLLSAYISRLDAHGSTGVGHDLVEISVRYYRIAGIGRE